MISRVPLVSIVTPSLNQGKLIEDTILSVKNQDYPNIEHIVIDAVSTDNTIDILKKHEREYNLKWICEPDEGQSDALNKGLRLAKGEIIGWLNSDDVYFSKDVISYVAEQLMRKPNVDVIYGDDVLIDENNHVFRVRQISNWNYDKLLRGFSISQPATFFRKNVILKNHLNIDLHFAMDFEFWLRIGKLYRFEHVNKILAGNRVHKARKRISGAKQAKIEDRMIMEEYGQKFDLTYHLFHYLLDLPDLQIRKILGIVAILRIRRAIGTLAFEGKCKSIGSLIISQISPSSWLLR